MPKFPNGQIDENDEGGLQIALYTKGKVGIMEFPKETLWIGFEKPELLALIEELKILASKI